MNGADIVEGFRDMAGGSSDCLTVLYLGFQHVFLHMSGEPEQEWADYELLRYELEEANEVCHGNWIEIQHQREYIVQLQELLTRHGIAVPPEY